MKSNISVIFGIVTSVLALIVDTVTLISWFTIPNLFYSDAISLPIPIFNISLSWESIILVTLLYALIVPSLIWLLQKSIIASFISTATIPLFFLWASLYQYIPGWISVSALYVWANIYIAFAIYYFLLSKHQKYYYRTSRYNVSLVDLLKLLLSTGLLLTPLSIWWLHDTYMLNWLASLLLGVLICNIGSATIFGFLIYRAFN